MPTVVVVGFCCCFPCSLTHCSYHFALSNINIALASTNIGHVLCSYFNCTLCLEFPFFCFPGKLLLGLYNLDQVSTPSGNSSYQPIPRQVGLTYPFIHATAFTAHLWCSSHCARCRGTVVKIKVASCRQGSYLLTSETGSDQNTQTNEWNGDS